MLKNIYFLKILNILQRKQYYYFALLLGSQGEGLIFIFHVLFNIYQLKVELLQISIAIQGTAKQVLFLFVFNTDISRVFQYLTTESLIISNINCNTKYIQTRFIFYLFLTLIFTVLFNIYQLKFELLQTSTVEQETIKRSFIIYLFLNLYFTWFSTFIN